MFRINVPFLPALRKKVECFDKPRYLLSQVYGFMLATHGRQIGGRNDCESLAWCKYLRYVAEAEKGPRQCRIT